MLWKSALEMLKTAIGDSDDDTDCCVTFGWRLWAFRLSLHRLHRRKHGESSKIVDIGWRITNSEIAGRLGLSWNMTANSNGGLGHVARLRKVCVLVAHWQAEATACVCLPGTVEWSQKPPSLPVWVHERRQNLGLLLPNSSAFRVSFPGCVWNSWAVIADSPTCDSKMDLLHKLRMRILWRWQQWPVTKINIL
jgi:hypothetical protein